MCVQVISVTTQNNEDKLRILHAHSRSCVPRVLRVLRVVSLDLGFHVVIGVGRLNVQQEGRQYFTTHTNSNCRVLSFWML